MEVLKQLIPLLLTFSLAGLVLTVGLNSEKGDILYVLRRPVLLGKAMLAVLVLPPIAAALLVWMLPISPAVKAGIMLMAVAPVPPLVPGQELGAGGRKAYAYGVYVAMALLTIISVPIVFDVASRLFGRQDTVSIGTVAMTVLTGVIVPLAIGLIIRAVAPTFSGRAAPWVYKLSMLLVVLAFVPILIQIWSPLTQLIGDGTLLAMSVVVLVCLLTGHILGGPDRVDRSTLAIASSVRHPGIAMALAGANFGDPHITAAILLFMLVGLALGTVYKIWFKRTAPEPTAAPAV
jgi:BASS family bile acid:Na+ symporter